VKHIIESKFVRLRKNVIERHRRIRTPFFYINLKSIKYRFVTENVNHIFGVTVPDRINLIYERWVYGENKAVLDKKLIVELQKANEGITNNVLYIASMR